MINNRDWALFGWLAVLLVLGLLKKDLRSNAGGLIRQLAQPKLSGTILLMAAWVYGLVLGARHIGLWESWLLKDTLFWFFTSGLVFWINSASVGRPSFFRRTLKGALGAALVLEFYLNLYVFSLPVEVFLLPTLALLGAVSAFAGMKEEYRSAKKLTDMILATVGFVVLGHVTSSVVRNWPDAAQVGTAQELVLPVWLTVGIVPFVYLFGLIVTYETAFMRVGFFSKDRRERLRCKVALVSVCHVRPSLVAVAGGMGIREAIAATSLRDARRRLRVFLQTREG